MLILNTYDILKSGATTEEIGGKAAGLYKLSTLGFNVPEWFCVHSDLFSLLKKMDFPLEYTPENIKKFEDIIEENGYLKEIHDKLNEISNSDNYYYAVRSSANLEDSGEQSFAGLFESYLDISKNDIVTNIYKAFCDVYDEKVKLYCKINSIDLNQIKFSVVIQKMIKPEFAGVSFSVNPITGSHDELLVSTVPGLGDKLVDGSCVSNNYKFDNKNKLIDKTIEFQEVDNLKVMIDVAKVCRRIENKWNCPVDIEWAYDGQLRLLQARPITTYKNESIFVIDNSNVVESFPGVTLPLTFSFAQKIYKTVFMDSLVSLSLVREKSPEITNKLIHYHEGRIFYNLTSWYEMMLSFPLARYYIPTWEESLGIKDGLNVKYQSDGILKSIRYTLVPACSFLTILFTLNRKTKKLEKIINDKLEKSRASYVDLDQEEKTVKDFVDLIKDFSIGWDVTLVNDLYVFIFSGLTKYVLSFESYKYENLFNEYVTQEDSLESMKPLDSMVTMANYIKKNISNYEELTLQELRKYSTEFAQLFEIHIDKYGDRSLEDLKLESITFRQDPELLYVYIKSMIDLEITVEREYENKTSNPHKFRSGVRKKLFEFFMNKAKNSIEIRERFRLYRSRFYGVARDFFIRHGSLLESNGKLLKKNDVFYLTMSELENSDLDYLSIVENRKKDFSHYKEMNSTVPRYIVKGDRYDPIITTIDPNLKSYKGTACSQGVVRAEVIVVKNLDEARDNPSLSKGKILVSPMTDPGWIYLMKNSVGLIVEKGSILSHSAIIGRELGLPTIVNIPSITEILKTGQVVTLDGHNGVIIIHE